jgi:hypothetical protein
MQTDQKQHIAKAFVSCSLRNEDRNFVNLVANILHHYQIKPFGTVGMYSASTENPVQLMKKNIEQSDFVVIAATKRYLTKDSISGKDSNSISEMIHTEAGMAFANSKPVVVFVKEGTNVGSFLPSITQYITLDGTQKNLDSQHNLILSLLNSAYQKSQEIKRQKSWQELGKLVMGGLAIYGGLKLLGDDSEEEFDN